MDGQIAFLLMREECAVRISHRGAFGVLIGPGLDIAFIFLQEKDAEASSRRNMLRGMLAGAAISLPAAAAKADDQNAVASSRMSYSRFLEYLDMGRVKKVISSPDSSSPSGFYCLLCQSCMGNMVFDPASAGAFV